MPARKIRTLDQRIADAKRELAEMEATKRVREDKTLKWIASVERKLRIFSENAYDEKQPLLVAAAMNLGTYLEQATRKEDPALPFEEGAGEA